MPPSAVGVAGRERADEMANDLQTPGRPRGRFLCRERGSAPQICTKRSPDDVRTPLPKPPRRRIQSTPDVRIEPNRNLPSHYENSFCIVRHYILSYGSGFGKTALVPGPG